MADLDYYGFQGVNEDVIDGGDTSANENVASSIFESYKILSKIFWRDEHRYAHSVLASECFRLFTMNGINGDYRGRKILESIFLNISEPSGQSSDDRLDKNTFRLLRQNIDGPLLNQSLEKCGLSYEKHRFERTYLSLFLRFKSPKKLVPPHSR